MLKRFMGLLLAAMLLVMNVPAWAEGDGEQSALTMEELTEWVAGYKARALASKPLNDPHAVSAKTEDGYLFIYDFATLYMDSPDMTENSVVRSLVITSPEEKGPRGTGVDQFTQELLAAYYNENPNLTGDRDFATLYVSDTLPASAAWAWVQRDGQRILMVQYAVHEQLATGGDGYTDMGLVYTIQDDLVAAIRAYGLDARVEAEDVSRVVGAAETVMEADSYRQVPMSYVGTDLTPFGEEDLTFSGVNFATLTPESAAAALGECLEDQWMEDDTGEYIRTMEFAGCDLTFMYDANKQNPRLDMLAISTPDMEGPRCVRIGDAFSSVLNRFRHGEGEFDGVSAETLYGTEGAAPCGSAEYGADASATLRYLLRLSDGREIALYMGFQQMALNEILLYVND